MQCWLCLLKSGEHSSLLDCMASQAGTRLWVTFSIPLCRVCGHSGQSTAPLAPLPLPLRGWRLMNQTGFVKPSVWKTFLECRKMSQPTLPNTWDLKPHIARPGMVKSLPQDLIYSCSNKEKNLQQPEVSVFRFALSLVAAVPVTPGSCWCKIFPREVPLFLEMAENIFEDFKFQK